MTTATFTLADMTAAFAKSDNPDRVRGFYRSRALPLLASASPDEVLAAVESGLLTEDDLASAAESSPAAAPAPAKSSKSSKSKSAPAKPKAAPKRKPTKRERLGITGEGFEVAYDPEVSEKCGGTPMIALYLDGRSLKTVSARVIAGIVAAGEGGLASMLGVLVDRGLYDADGTSAAA